MTHVAEPVFMDSFRFVLVGRLSRDPEFVVKGNTRYVRFRLTGDDYWEDENGHPHAEGTHHWVTAFGPIADVIAAHAEVGDQLIVHGRLREYTPRNSDPKKKRKHYYSLTATGFRFGEPGPRKQRKWESGHEKGKSAESHQ